jgi:hypothetical protein
MLAIAMVVPRMTGAANATDSPWTSYARFYFRHYGNEGTVLAPLLAPA